jgi:hypothetical protein
MNIEKSKWIANGDAVSLSVPFTKVNRERRTVAGFATLDNKDQTGDVVTQEASLKAFEKFRGNIREMHQPVAVGKLVSFKPEMYYDPISKSFYNGVYVETYISKGAQDTWEKVLDGTLAGFSIGGKIVESDNEVNKADGTSVRFIKEYDLIELSIVDSPANELCNILSIQKMNGQLMFKGMAAETVTENIFYCEESDSVFISKDDSYNSPITGNPAKLIGWVESNDVNKSKEVGKILDSFKKSRLTLSDIQANAKGGNKLSETNNDQLVEKIADLSDSTPKAAAVAEAAVVEAPVEETVVDAPVVESAVAEAEVSAEAEVEQSADTDVDVFAKAADAEPDFAKMLVDLKGFFAETLEKASQTNSAQVAEMKDSVETFTKNVDTRITELTEQHANLSKAVQDIKDTIDGVEKRVMAVESETAIKKSQDLGGSQGVTTKKSQWNGSFLGSVNDLIK